MHSGGAYVWPELLCVSGEVEVELVVHADVDLRSVWSAVLVLVPVKLKVNKSSQIL